MALWGLLLTYSKPQAVEENAERSLKALADRKFSEIEKTHKLFIRLSEKMLEAVTNASDKLLNSDNVDAIHRAFSDSVEAVQRTVGTDMMHVAHTTTRPRCIRKQHSKIVVS